MYGIGSLALLRYRTPSEEREKREVVYVMEKNRLTADPVSLGGGRMCGLGGVQLEPPKRGFMSNTSDTVAFY